jgi:hypothetical protein
MMSGPAAGKAGVSQVHLRRLNESLPEVVEIRGHENDLACHFEYVKPVTNRRNGDPEGCSKVGLVQNLSVTTRQKTEKTAKCHQVPHVGNRPDISLQVCLQVGGKPKATNLGAGRVLLGILRVVALLSWFPRD